MLRSEDVSEGLEELLTCGFWSCVSLIVKRDERNSDSIGKFLAEMKADWPTSCVSEIVRTLSSLSWSRIAPHAEKLLHRMSSFLPNVHSATHISSFFKIAEQQLEKYIWHFYFNNFISVSVSFFYFSFYALVHLLFCSYPHEAAKLYSLSAIRLLEASSSVDVRVNFLLFFLNFFFNFLVAVVPKFFFFFFFCRC